MRVHPRPMRDSWQVWLQCSMTGSHSTQLSQMFRRVMQPYKCSSFQEGQPIQIFKSSEGQPIQVYTILVTHRQLNVIKTSISHRIYFGVEVPHCK